MKSINKPIWIYLAILLYGLLALLPYIGSVHLFDWDEIIFAESAREMMVSGDYLTVSSNFIPFWEKPPLFFWLQALSMKLFGVTEFAARFPNMICGILTLITLFRIGRKISGQGFGVLWVIAFATAVLPFFYFKSGIIDPWLNLFILLGFTYFIYYLDPENNIRRYFKLVLSALFFGLAVLTKGPVPVLLLGLSFIIYLVVKRIKISVSFGHVIVFLLVLISIGGSWYIYQITQGRFDVVMDFIRYQAGLFTNDYAGHGGFFGFHFVILFFGVFPGSILFLISFTKKQESTDLQQMFRTWMYILFFLVLVLFSFVKTKLVHYSSLAYFPITFLAAWVWEKWISRKIEIKGWQLILIAFVALMYSIAAVLLPILGANTKFIPQAEFTKFPLFWQEAINANLCWTGLEFLTGIFLIAGIIFSIWLIRKRDTKGMIIMHVVTLLFVTSMVYIYTPKIEAITQNAAIEFIEEHNDENAYITTLGFRSFATLFYGKRSPEVIPGIDDAEEVLSLNLNTDVYVIMKQDDKQKYMERYPRLELLYEKNGFVFTKMQIDSLPDYPINSLVH